MVKGGKKKCKKNPITGVKECKRLADSAFYTVGMKTVAERAARKAHKVYKKHHKHHHGSGHCHCAGRGKGMHGGRLRGFKKFVTKEGRKALKHAQTRTKKGTMANKLIKNVNKAVSGKAGTRREGIYKLAEIAINQAAKASKK